MITRMSANWLAEAIETGRYRGRRTGGLVDRLPGADLSHGRRERLSAAMARFEAASKAGDDIAREMADAEIDAVLNEGREAAAQVAAPPPVSFDGGVQKRQFTPAYRQDRESPAALMLMAFQASAERRKRQVTLP